MPHVSKIAVRLLLLTMAGLAMLAIDISTAFAQSASCGQLQATLETLERNRAYQWKAPVSAVADGATNAGIGGDHPRWGVFSYWSSA